MRKTETALLLAMADVIGELASVALVHKKYLHREPQLRKAVVLLDETIQVVKQQQEEE